MSIKKAEERWTFIFYSALKIMEMAGVAFMLLYQYLSEIDYQIDYQI